MYMSVLYMSGPDSAREKLMKKVNWTAALVELKFIKTDLHPVFFYFLLPTPSPSSSAIIGKGWGGMRWQHLLDLRLCFPFGSPYSHLEAPNRWWLLHPYLLIWQEILYFTTGSLRYLKSYFLHEEFLLGPSRVSPFYFLPFHLPFHQTKGLGAE